MAVCRASARVEEEEPRKVWWPARLHEQFREQGSPERVRGDDVHPAVLNDGGDLTHCVEQALGSGTHLLSAGGGAAALSSHTLIRRVNQVAEVRVFGLVELQGAADAVEDAV